ncbi:MAG: hypothetical protein AAGC63_11345 [Propionicimonas sp.]|nr:hypothetical protein [Propionicimonas sp.]
MPDQSEPRMEVFPLTSRRAAVVAGIAALGIVGAGVVLALAQDPGGPGAVLLPTPACQPQDSPIQVRLEPPGFTGDAALPWQTRAVTLSGIAPGCVGHRYQLAVADPSGWRPVRLGRISATTVSIPLPGLGADATQRVAIAILDPDDGSTLG